MFETIIITGIVVSYLYYEVFGVFPGGIIVPGFLVLYMDEPSRIIITVLIALVTYFIVHYFLSRHIIIYGVRRFFIMILVAYLMGIGLENFFGNLNFDVTFVPIGYLIGGIIANNYVRQGVLMTTINMAAAVILIQLILIIVGVI